MRRFATPRRTTSTPYKKYTVQQGTLYDPTKEDSYILYIDANNLYGWAMSLALPKDSYAWLSDAEVREAGTALTSDNIAKRLGFFDIAARARR